MLRTIGYVLNVKDVLNDAHSTFIKDHNYRSNEAQESQMEDMIKEKAFNWSDEDIKSISSNSSSNSCGGFK